MENQRRSSAQSGLSVQSGQSVEEIGSPGTEAAKRDVLADMRAFEAELDALRKAAEGGGK